MEPLIVYYSSPSLNTHRFVESLGIKAIRIPTSMKVDMEQIKQPYVLICPTYADDDGSKAVPKQVIKFLNDPQNRNLMIGVIASGNRNFGDKFAYSGDVIARKCSVPILYKFELSGTPTDILKVQTGVYKLWKSLEQTMSPKKQQLQKMRQRTQ